MANIEKVMIDDGHVEAGSNEYVTETWTVVDETVYLEGTLLGRITASDKLVVVDTTAEDGSEVPCAILHRAYTATASGDVSKRVIEVGKVWFSRLVLHADGDNSNITGVILDQLRARKINAVVSRELGIVDADA